MYFLNVLRDVKATQSNRKRNDKLSLVFIMFMSEIDFTFKVIK